MIKKLSTIALIAGSLTAVAQENYSIQLTDDNQLSVSKNLQVDNVQIIDGIDALYAYQEQLQQELDSLAKADTLKSIGQSADILEELVFIDSLIERNDSQLKATVSNGGSVYCNNNIFLNYTFNDSFFRYNLNVTASTGMPGPFPPDTPYQLVKSTATVTNTTVNTDTDTSTGNSLFVSASSSIGSGLHASNNPLPFVAQGNYFISFPNCDAFRIIKVEGTKAYGSAPTITSITN